MTLTESELIHDWNRAGGEELRPARGRSSWMTRPCATGCSRRRCARRRSATSCASCISSPSWESSPPTWACRGPGRTWCATSLVWRARSPSSGLPIEPNCAARTVAQDIQPIVEISQQTGVAIEVCCFLGSSPIRQYTEVWEMDRLLELTEDAVGLAARAGLPVMYVTEDTTRARPEDLRRLYTAAVEAGARRVCIADTVGHATPEGTAHLVRFIRGVVDATGETVGVDWHGHSDRGLAVANSLAAAAAGADRLHGTALGIGERVGNTPIDQLLVNMQLMGWIDRDLSKLPEYCELVAECTGVPLPDNYPVVGRDAFRTATGVHAAAIIKARGKGDDWLADRIYSGVPASLVGRRQEIEVGPMSGRSNVVCWLRDRGFEPTDELVDAVFARAKEASRVLDEAEIRAICSAPAVTGRDA